MRPGLPCNSVWLVMLGPVPRQLGPHSVSVLTRYLLFSLKHLPMVKGTLDAFHH